MKKNIIYFALFFLFVSVSNEAFSQVWTGSNVSTETMGKVGIGTSTSGTIKTSIQTTAENNIGLKVVNLMGSSIDVPSVSSSDRFGIYTFIESQSENDYALYAHGGGRGWAGYFKGNVAIDGRLDMLQPNGNSWTLALGWQQGNKDFYLLPRDDAGNWDFNRALVMENTGHLKKRVSEDDFVEGNKAFSVSLGHRDEFLVKANGHVFAREIQVLATNMNFPDYVFAKDYDLLPLADLKEYIKKNKHLPNIPSAKEVEKDGLGLGKLTKLQMEKIEELTLYIIEMNERIEKLEEENKELKEGE